MIRKGGLTIFYSSDISKYCGMYFTFGQDNDKALQTARKYDVIFFLLHFTRKLCIVKVWLFGQLLCTHSNDFHFEQFVWRYPNTLYLTQVTAFNV